MRSRGNLSYLRKDRNAGSKNCRIPTKTSWMGLNKPSFKRSSPSGLGDPPPLKWSDLRYVFDIKEDCNGKEAIQARRGRREAAPGGCSWSPQGQGMTDAIRQIGVS